MSTNLKEWLLKTIAELEEERDSVPGAVNEDAAMSLAAMRLALASLEGNGTLANEGTITATLFKPVADLYEVTVPSGRSTTFTKDAAEASDCRVMGWSVQEYVKLDRYQAAMLQGAEPVSNRDELPDGWVAVPVEPTESMCDIKHVGLDVYTGVATDDHYSIGGEQAAKVWKAMLSKSTKLENRNGY